MNKGKAVSIAQNNNNNNVQNWAKLTTFWKGDDNVSGGKGKHTDHKHTGTLMALPASSSTALPILLLVWLVLAVISAAP